MKLFDFVKMIGAHIEFTGSLEEGHTFLNTNVVKGFKHAERIHGGLRGSVFGRSEGDLHESLDDLAASLAGQTIELGTSQYEVPVELYHDRESL